MSTTTLPDTDKMVGILANRVDQALGNAPADLVIKNVNLFNLDDGSIEKTDIAICGDRIVGVYGQYEGAKEFDATGLFAVPGFINGHGHVESSLLTPFEYDRCVLPRGTTAFVCDPHEIANVLGEKGLKYFLDSSEHMAMDLFVQLPSCVPATKLETAGGVINLKTLAKFMNHMSSLGLAEFMDTAAVLQKQPESLAKLALYAMASRHVCGHMPGMCHHKVLSALASVGICNDHESTDYEQALAKLRLGIFVIARLGTVCKDVPKLAKLINSTTGHRMGLCTDDLKVADIVRDGDIDNAIRTALANGAELLSAYRASSLNTAQHFGLRDRGRLAPGYLADTVLLRDLERCRVEYVFKNGRQVTDKLFAERQTVKPVGYCSVKLPPVSAEDFVVLARAQPVPVAGLIKDQVVTESLRATLPVNGKGELQANPQEDVLKVFVLERHGKNGNRGHGWVKGFGLQGNCAIASTHGHDSHNLTVVGSSEEDMAVAVNRVRKMQGGFVVVKEGRVIAELSLPVAGLMADPGKPYEQVVDECLSLNKAVQSLRPAVENPILYTAFLPLSVIPTIRISDFGVTLFDPAKGDQGPRLIEDQRPMKIHPGADCQKRGF